MLILNEQGEKVENPDLEVGRLDVKQRNVVHRYIVDVPEQTHTEVVAEYPETGGKDIAYVVDVPEQGHWATFLENGGEVEFDGDIPDNAHDVDTPDIQTYQVYHVYTAEELEEIKAREAAAKEAAEKAAEREAFIDGAPATVDELMLAVAELGSMIGGK